MGFDTILDLTAGVYTYCYNIKCLIEYVREGHSSPVLGCTCLAVLHIALRMPKVDATVGHNDNHFGKISAQAVG